LDVGIDQIRAAKLARELVDQNLPWRDRSDPPAPCQDSHAGHRLEPRATGFPLAIELDPAHFLALAVK
jgi:hypothetical protein